MKFRHALAILALVVAGSGAVLPPAANAQPTGEAAQQGVTLIIRFEASEEGLAALESILDGVSEAMKAEEGFVSAKVYRNIDTPNVFILEEVWQTKALHLAHFDRINRSGDWAKIKALLVTEPQMGYFALKPAGER